MKWFNEHLNWTYAIINVAVTVIGTVLMFALMWGTLRSFIDHPEVFPMEILAPVMIISGVLSLVSLGTSAWVLSRKGQSLLWLLLVLVSSFVLFILVLVLPYKKPSPGDKSQGDKGKITDSDYYQSRGVDAK
jgi:hypothetical protein